MQMHTIQPQLEILITPHVYHLEMVISKKLILKYHSPCRFKKTLTKSKPPLRSMQVLIILTSINSINSNSK